MFIIILIIFLVLFLTLKMSTFIFLVLFLTLFFISGITFFLLEKKTYEQAGKQITETWSTMSFIFAFAIVLKFYKDLRCSLLSN